MSEGESPLGPPKVPSTNKTEALSPSQLQEPNPYQTFSPSAFKRPVDSFQSPMLPQQTSPFQLDENGSPIAPGRGHYRCSLADSPINGLPPQQQPPPLSQNAQTVSGAPADDVFSPNAHYRDDRLKRMADEADKVSGTPSSSSATNNPKTDAQPSEKDGEK